MYFTIFGSCGILPKVLQASTISSCSYCMYLGRVNNWGVFIEGCLVCCSRKKKKHNTVISMSNQHMQCQNKLTASSLPFLQSAFKTLSSSSSTDHLESMARNAFTMASSVTSPPAKVTAEWRDWRWHSSELPGVIDFMQNSKKSCSHRVTSTASEFGAWLLYSN